MSLKKFVPPEIEQLLVTYELTEKPNAVLLTALIDSSNCDDTAHDGSRSNFLPQERITLCEYYKEKNLILCCTSFGNLLALTRDYKLVKRASICGEAIKFSAGKAPKYLVTENGVINIIDENLDFLESTSIFAETFSEKVVYCCADEQTSKESKLFFATGSGKVFLIVKGFTSHIIQEIFACDESTTNRHISCLHAAENKLFLVIENELVVCAFEESPKIEQRLLLPLENRPKRTFVFPLAGAHNSRAEIFLAFESKLLLVNGKSVLASFDVGGDIIDCFAWKSNEPTYLLLVKNHGLEIIHLNLKDVHPLRLTFDCRNIEVEGDSKIISIYEESGGSPFPILFCSDKIAMAIDFFECKEKLAVPQRKKKRKGADPASGSRGSVENDRSKSQFSKFLQEYREKKRLEQFPVIKDELLDCCAKYDPRTFIKILRSERNFSLDLADRLCRLHGVKEGLIYINKKTGNLQKAMELALELGLIEEGIKLYLEEAANGNEEEVFSVHSLMTKYAIQKPEFLLKLTKESIILPGFFLDRLIRASKKGEALTSYLLKVVENRRSEFLMNREARSSFLIEYHDISKNNFTLNKRGVALNPRGELCCFCKKYLFSQLARGSGEECYLFLGCRHSYHRECYGSDEEESRIVCKVCMYWNTKI